VNSIIVPHQVPGKVKISVPWFSASGAPNFVCHNLNRRHREQDIVEMMNCLRDNGLIAEARGHPWAVVGPDGGPPYQLLTYGTLSRALYRAVAAWPENENIRMTLEAGCEDLTLFVNKLPGQVVRWLRDYHNGFLNIGSAMTIVQIMNEIPEIEANFAAYRTIEQVAGRNSGQLRLKWLQTNYPNRFTSNNEYESVQAMVHKLRDHGIFGDILHFIGEGCKFRAVSNHVAMMNMHALTVLVSDTFAPMYDIATIKMIFVEALRFVLPIGTFASDNPLKGRDVEWLFDKVQTGKISYLRTPMVGSVVYTTQRKKGCKRAAIEPVPVPAAKKRGKAGKAAKKDAGVAALSLADLPAETFESMVSTTENGDGPGEVRSRQKFWLDDVLAAISTTYDSLTTKVTNEGNLSFVSRFCQFCAEPGRVAQFSGLRRGTDRVGA
jgi:hypothetical protein